MTSGMAAVAAWYLSIALIVAAAGIWIAAIVRDRK